MEAARPDQARRTLAACRRVWVGVALFSACLNLLTLAVPLYMMQIYDRVLTTRSIDTLLALSVMVAGALAVLGLLDALRRRVAVRVGAWLDRALSGAVLSGSVHEALRAGGNGSAQGLRDLAAVRDYVGGPAVLPLFDAPWAPLFLACVFLVHPVLGWIGLGGAVALLACAVLNDIGTRRRLVEANHASTRGLNAADTALRNADTIAAMGMLAALTRRWQEAVAHERGLQVAASDVSGSVVALAKSLRFGLQVAMLGVGGYLVIGNEMSAGGIIASAVVLARGLAPIEQLIGTWRAFVGARTAWRRLRSLLVRSPQEAAGLSLPRPTGRLDVEAVRYAPPGAREAVLNDVSLGLEPAEVLGVVGPSGAGKSTLARLLVGSLVPTAGHVRLDGAEVSAWRGRHLGYMPQSIELLPGTVRDNIARLQEAADDEVVAASQLAGAHDMVLRLPEGYDTRLGDGGVAVSGGQRQLIALARAVFGEPALVVLDEPNAHLDSAGESGLLETVNRLREQGATVVVVSQRPGILRRVDKVLMLHDGSVARFEPAAAMLRELRQAAQRGAQRSHHEA